MLRLALTLLVCLGVAAAAWGHPGRTDANGGHYNRKTGGYHYHGGGPPVSSSRATAPTKPIASPPRSSSNPPQVRTTPRTEARTKPRTAYRSHVLTEPKQLAPVQKPEVATRFVVHFPDGRTREIVGYDESENAYQLDLGSGARIGYPKSLIERIEPLPEPVVKPDAWPPREAVVARVVRVVDGDTIRLDNGETVRLIGVDTPETVHPTKPVEAFGKEASNATRRALEGEAVRLYFDPANTATDHRDRYGRLLAYVERSRDGLDVNGELIRHGYGHAYTNYPFARIEEYRGYEREARENGRGLWATAAPIPAPPTESEPAPSPEPAIDQPE